MRYYRITNEYIYKNEKDGKVIGFGVKQPKFMKKYPYNKLGFKLDGSQCIVQSEDAIREAKELALEEAQALENEWVKDRGPITKMRETIGENGAPEIVKDAEGKPIEDILPASSLDIASYDVPAKKEERDRLHAKFGVKAVSR